MSTDVKRATTALAALLLTVLAATPARAADDTGGPAAGQRIAQSLRDSPVYVAEAYADAVPLTRQKQLADHIRRTGLPIKVVLTPLTKGDAFDGDSAALAGTLRDRLPAQRELVLITTDDAFPDSLRGFEWPTDTHQARKAVAAAGFLDETRNAGLADLTAKAVDLVAEGKGEQRYAEATRNLRTPAPQAEKDRPEGGPGWWLLPAAASLATALTALAAHALRRSRRTAPAVPHLVFATARAADEAELRRQAEAEVLALGEATRVLDKARGLPDLAGALALALEGQDTLDDTPGLPLCFFDPRHGRAALRTPWRRLGHRDRLDVAACQNCADALRDHRAPEVLTDRDEDGRTVPYFEVPPQRSAWAATGYGSLMRVSAGFNRHRSGSPTGEERQA